MLWEALGAAREMGRLHQIAAVLIRYGFGDVVQRTGMAAALERTGRLLGWEVPEELTQLTSPARLRCALQQLGPTFVKLGQILATRVDLLPPDWIAELGTLQDSAPAAPLADVWAQLKEDLGEDPHVVFTELETRPMAAASLAQVHRARLPNGTAVLLKVRRPGIRPVVEADLRLLNRLTAIVEAQATDLRRYRPREVMAQLTQSLRRELDFSYEGRNAERIAATFATNREIVVPRVHWQWSGERLNVQDYISGIPGRDLAQVDASGLDRRLLARRGANAALKMMLEDGFFHADLHPGNVLYLPDNRVAFIDFGMVGRLSEQRRYQVAVLLHYLVSRDSTRVAEVLADWGDGTADVERLTARIETFLDQYHGVPLRHLDLAAMLSDLVTILQDHDLALPVDLALLIKAFIALEGMGRQLDPEFDIAAETAPFLRRVLVDHYAPDALVQRGWRTLGSALNLLDRLPQDLTGLLRAARHGRLQAQLDVVSLRPLADRLDRAATRLAVAIVTASLIIGSSIVLAVGDASRMPVLPSIARFGITVAAIGAAWLVISVRRGRKKC